ncbi:LysR family transcriptional regulator [Sciscionella sediminilitoris]|uniref:LysR family transcriptional regulator n=1 Tax=Sciscionella sediminilitoris TaxID=1445613 RepID=UPI0004DF6E88|nr:LysR family transcriptional regulator [Sciscionella sp. SE31]
MLNAERLRVLLAVRDHGSVAAAATALSVTPSGVSQQLGKLEHEAGHALTARDGRSVRLTNAGVVLADRAERMTAELREAERELADLDREVLGPVRIGSLGSSIRLLVAPALAELTAEHPRVRPSVFDGESLEHMPLLQAGKLDLIVGERWPDMPSPMPAPIEYQVLIEEEVHVALAENHPYADRPVLDLAEAADLVWVSCPESDIRNALVAALASQHIEPRLDYNIVELPTQAAIVRAGLAAALMPAISIGEVPDGVVGRPLRPPMTRQIYVAWRRGSDRPVVRAFVRTLQRVAAGLKT